MCLRHLCSLSTNNMDDVTVVTHLGRSHGQRCQRGGGPHAWRGVVTLCSPARASLYTCRWHLYTGGTRTLGSGTCILGSGTCTLGRSICTPDSGTCTLDSGTCTQVAAPAHLVARHRGLPSRPARPHGSETVQQNNIQQHTGDAARPLRTTSRPPAARRRQSGSHASGGAGRQPPQRPWRWEG